MVVLCKKRGDGKADVSRSRNGNVERRRLLHFFDFAVDEKVAWLEIEDFCEVFELRNGRHEVLLFKNNDMSDNSETMSENVMISTGGSICLMIDLS